MSVRLSDFLFKCQFRKYDENGNFSILEPEMVLSKVFHHKRDDKQSFRFIFADGSWLIFYPTDNHWESSDKNNFLSRVEVITPVYTARGYLYERDYKNGVKTSTSKGSNGFVDLLEFQNFKVME